MYSHTSSFITIFLYIHIVDATVLETSPWRRVLSWNADSRAGAAGQATERAFTLSNTWVNHKNKDIIPENKGVIFEIKVLYLN